MTEMNGPFLYAVGISLTTILIAAVRIYQHLK